MKDDPEQILETLHRGGLIPAAQADAEGILSTTIGKCISEPLRAVGKARNSPEDAIRQFYWVTGRPGCGKSQALSEFIQRLGNVKGATKYAYCSLRIDQDVDTNTTAGLILSIIRETLSVGALPEAAKIAERAIIGREADSRDREAIAFGLDVIASTLKFPPLSLFATVGYRKFISWVRMTGPYVRSKLRKTWKNQPKTLNILNDWLMYALHPGTETREKFHHTLLALAQETDLFDIYCRLLQTAGYSTLVLVLDEVSVAALRTIKTWWNQPNDPKKQGKNLLNLVIVGAAQEEVYAAATNDETLDRRLCDTKNGRSDLKGPRIEESPVLDDDFAHAVEVVTRLLKKATHLRRHHPPEPLEDLRRRCAEGVLDMHKQVKPMTWQNLWCNVIDHYAVL